MKRLAVFLCAALLTCGMILAGCQNEEPVSEPISTNASQRASVLSQWEETERSAEVRLSLPQKEYPFGQDVIPISVHWEGTENEISPEDFQLELQKDGKWFVMAPGDYRIVVKHSDSSGQMMQLELFHFPAVYEYEAGTYRIVMKTKPSGWTSVEFTLTMPAINEALGLQENNSYRMDYLPEKQINDISLQIEKESYSGSKDTEIVYTLQNHGETSVTFYPRLVSFEVKREDGWYTFMGGSTLPDTVVDEGIEVAPGAEHQASLSFDDCRKKGFDLQPGRYRIVWLPKPMDGRWTAIEFDLVE